MDLGTVKTKIENRDYRLASLIEARNFVDAKFFNTFPRSGKYKNGIIRNVLNNNLIV